MQNSQRNLCQKYRAISFINHFSNVKLKITFHRLHLQDNEIIAEEQAGFSQEGAPQSKYLFSGSFAWYSYNINVISIMSLQISRRTLIVYAMKPDGQLWRNTKSMPASYASNICMTRPSVQCCSVASNETGPKVQFESDKDVYSTNIL